jgi:hypothetical protein
MNTLECVDHDARKAKPSQIRRRVSSAVWNGFQIALDVPGAVSHRVLRRKSMSQQTNEEEIPVLATSDIC